MEKKIVFSENFVWGAATSAYQIEGAVKEDGKGEHIWDVYTKEPGKVYSGHTGEVACDHYHRYKEDVQLMKEMGLKAYRFSIDWSRVLPEGFGRAVQMLRAYGKQKLMIGYAPTSSVCYPETDHPEDIEAARKAYFSLQEDDSNWTWNVSW